LAANNDSLSHGTTDGGEPPRTEIGNIVEPRRVLSASRDESMGVRSVIVALAIGDVV